MNNESLYCPRVSDLASKAYAEKTAAIADRMHRYMTASSEFQALLGNRPVSDMYNNNSNRTSFMSNVFALNDTILIEKTVRWVVEMCNSRGFTVEIFQLYVSMQIEAVKQELEEQVADEILPVYEWILKFVESIFAGINKSNQPNDSLNTYEQNVHLLTTSLLDGSFTNVNAVVNNVMNSGLCLQEFCVCIVAPALYRIGFMWERGEITVAQEHMATSIIIRIMSILFCNGDPAPVSKGKIVIGGCENEQHEVGARMVADLFEIDGWDVTYVGAGIPILDFVRLVSENKFDILGISVTMAFCLNDVRSLITSVREAIPEIKIMVGGLAMSYIDSAAPMLGADWVIKSADQAILVADEWWSVHAHCK